LVDVDVATGLDVSLDLTALEAGAALPEVTVTPDFTVAPSRPTFGLAEAPWLQPITVWHQASRHPVPIALDCALGFGAALVATGSLATAITIAVVLCLAGVLFGLWKPRSIPETQGVSWLLLPLARTIITAVVIARMIGVGITDRRLAFGSVAVFVTVALLRAVLWQLIAAARRDGSGLQSTLVIGPLGRIAQIEHRLRTFPEGGLRFESSYTPTPHDGTDPESGRALVDRLLAHGGMEHVLCAADAMDDVVFKDFVRFAASRIDVSVLLPVAGLSAGQPHAHVGDLALIPIRLHSSRGSDAAKRVFDLAAAAILILLASPLLVLAALAIRIGSPGPAIFKQRRVGLGGKTFTIYKFRSMVVGAEAQRDRYLADNVNRGLLFKLDQDPRITPVGHILRRLSIDELPQLFNVVRGDMSLVGPRPLPVDPDEFDTGSQIRHQVLPGMTGLWQVHGANALPYPDMVELDLTYVATRSLGLDLILLLKTIPALLVRRAAY
jgi:exopolysaccharide biosynthesis polyprenyl glycosylphosphotransferase